MDENIRRYGDGFSDGFEEGWANGRTLLREDIEEQADGVATTKAVTYEIRSDHVFMAAEAQQALRRMEVRQRVGRQL